MSRTQYRALNLIVQTLLLILRGMLMADSYKLVAESVDGELKGIAEEMARFKEVVGE